jgi:hypothetical protein
MIVGGRIDDMTVVTEMLDRTLNLVVKLITHSENFIVDELNRLGFEVREVKRWTPTHCIKCNRPDTPLAAAINWSNFRSSICVMFFESR